MKYLLGSILALSALSAQGAPTLCPEGFWDMGANAAVVAFQCPSSNESARLFFCQREALLKQQVCTGARESIPCQWSADTESWNCHEAQNDFSRFDATIKKISDDQIHYHAKSHFNEVDLIGRLITAD